MTNLSVVVLTKEERCCDYCSKPIPVEKRWGAKFCSDICRKARWRDDNNVMQGIDWIVRELDQLQRTNPERFARIMARYQSSPMLPAPKKEISVSIAAETDKSK